MVSKNLQLNLILELRESINSSLWSIEALLKEHFPDQYENAYQHWIPQIATALYNETKWLPRGQHTLDDTIISIRDNDDSCSGVSKFIK